MRHHAFVIGAEAEEGIERASAWAHDELGLEIKGNPDVVVLRYGLFSPEDARYVSDIAAQAPFSGEYRALIIAASRAYHESQNALLKLFEEPPQGLCLFLILPSLGSLLPTLRSRVQVLDEGFTKSFIGVSAEAFLKATKEKRSAMIKKLSSGKDEEERREHREETITIVNGIEAAAYSRLKKKSEPEISSLLSDIADLRPYLYDRSAPVRMILEHLSLVTPKNLL